MSTVPDNDAVPLTLPLSERLARGVLISSAPLVRRLRALEFLLLRLFTHQGSELGRRRLRPESEIQRLLKVLELPGPATGSEQACSRYHQLIGQVLIASDLEQLEQRGLLRRVRSLKYALGAGYLNGAVVAAAVESLLILEHVRSAPGFARGAALKRARLPVEEKSLCLSWDRPAGVEVEPVLAEETPFPVIVVGEEASSPPELSSDPSTCGMTAPPTGTAASLTAASFTASSGAASTPGSTAASLTAASGATSTPSLTAAPGVTASPSASAAPGTMTAPDGKSPGSQAQPGAAASSLRTASAQALEIARRSRLAARTAKPRTRPTPAASRPTRRLLILSARWRPRLIGLVLFNLALTAVLGGRALLSDPAIKAVPARYQAYRIENNLGDLPLSSARRLGDVLMLTMDDRWMRLEEPARASATSFLIKQLMGKDGIQRILILDAGGRQLAWVGRETMAMTEGGR